MSELPNVPKEESTAESAMAAIKRSRMLSDFRELFNEMERRRYNTRWIMFFVAGVIVVIFYGIITDWVTDQAADVTSKYLENPKFKKDIVIFVEQTVNELVKSEKVQNDITGLLENAVYKLADNDKVKDKLTDLFVTIFRQQQIKNAGSELSEDVVRQLINSPEYENIRREAIEYVMREMITIVRNDEVQKNVGIASWNAFKVWFGMSPDSVTTQKT